MRKQFCDAMVGRSAARDMVFLTGDLGFMALEPLAAALGQRFVNAGVSEQNMISVAAALSRSGFETWAYSIAPFCYARPFEQIRNDVTFHGLPVKLVGNGGGYGYGVMGPTHHAIEDYGVLLTLDHLRVYCPVFDEDVPVAVEAAAAWPYAAYLRLGRGEPPQGYEVPAYAPWRQLVSGQGKTVVIASGPLAGTYIAALQALPDADRPNLWALAELPADPATMPPALITQLQAADIVCVAEEHVANGGAGMGLATLFLREGIAVRRFVHLHALSHVYETYGSQGFLRRKSRLDPQSLLGALQHGGALT